VGEPGAAADIRFDADALWKSTLVRTVERGPSIWPRLEDAPTTPAVVIAPQKETIVSPSEPPVPPAPDAPPAAPVVAPSAPSPAPVADTRLSIEEFMRIDLRTAVVAAAERVPKSKKLLKLQVDLGTEQRTLVAGIAEAYEPEALVGRTVVVVTNLKPATLMGIESNGMVLAASPEGGKPELVAFVTPPPPGSRVR
jgi:methionyl-tRNA synthetase